MPFRPGSDFPTCTRTPPWRPGVLVSALLLGACMHPVDAPAWRIDVEDPAAIVRIASSGSIDIDTAKGLTLWHPQRLTGPVRIRFEAMAVARGGPNDAVSDLNAFWMASDPAASDGSVFAAGRSGRFEGYDTLKTYYVGIGGNRNTTTRMRRYVGVPGVRPLLPEHDRTGVVDMLRPNRWTTITLIADGSHIAVERDGRTLFVLNDAEPYRSGWFALRTTQSHLKIRRLRISHR